MSSIEFLQRFKGRIEKMSKNGTEDLIKKARPINKSKMLDFLAEEKDKAALEKEKIIKKELKTLNNKQKQYLPKISKNFIL